MKKNGGCICQSTRIGTKNLIVWKQGKASIPGMSLRSLSRDRLEDDKIDEQEFETLMRRLMDIDCEL